MQYNYLTPFSVEALAPRNETAGLALWRQEAKTAYMELRSPFSRFDRGCCGPLALTSQDAITTHQAGC